VEHDGVLEKRELPFVIGVLADLSGRSFGRAETLAERRFVEINLENFDEVMRTIAPQLHREARDVFSEIKIPEGTAIKDSIKRRLANALGLLAETPSPDGANPLDFDLKFKTSVALSFLSLRDFEPSAILDQLPLLSRLYKNRERDLEHVIEEIHYLKQKYSQVEGAHLLYSEEDAKSLHDVIPNVVSGLLRRILQHPDFKRLEATWRGLHYLVRQSETGTRLKIKVLDVSKRDLAMDQKNAVEFNQFSLLARVYRDAFESAGGEPFGLLIGDYEFDESPLDLRVLAGISNVAAAADVPFVAAPSPSMFNIDSFDSLRSQRSISDLMDQPESYKWRAFRDKWRAFRDSDESQFVALVLPRVLGRPPYGANTHPVEAFPFEEFTGLAGSGQYLWMNAAWALAARVADAMARDGWPAAIRGVEGGGLVDGLPVPGLLDHHGNVVARCPTEIPISPYREVDLSRAGFIPLAHLKDTNRAVFFSVPTCHRPEVYDQPEATAAAALLTELNVVLCVSRFVHYLKIIGRDRIGSFSSAGGMQALMNTWLQGYISDDPEASAEDRFRYPLADGRVEVEDSPGKPGSFRVVLQIKLALHFEKSPVGVRTAFEVSGKGAPSG
jgi:type VI secretion system protein ImpC